MPKWSEAILTNKALEKIKTSALSVGEIKAAFEKYQKKEASPIPGCVSFIRILGSSEVGVIGRQKKNGFWLIVSVWKRNLFKSKK
jgi:hypothetical protein